MQTPSYVNEDHREIHGLILEIQKALQPESNGIVIEPPLSLSKYNAFLTRKGILGIDERKMLTKYSSILYAELISEDEELAKMAKFKFGSFYSEEQWDVWSSYCNEILKQ